MERSSEGLDYKCLTHRGAKKVSRHVLSKALYIRGMLLPSWTLAPLGSLISSTRILTAHANAHILALPIRVLCPGDMYLANGPSSVASASSIISQASSWSSTIEKGETQARRDRRQFPSVMSYSSAEAHDSSLPEKP